MLRFREIIKEASRLLKKRGSRVRMILAGIAIICAAVFPMLLSTNLTVVIFGDDYSNGLLVDISVLSVALLAGIFVTVPALSMVTTLTRQIYLSAKNGYVPNAEKGRYNYFRHLFGGFTVFFRYVILLLLIQITNIYTRAYAYELADMGYSLPVVFGVMPIWLIAILVMSVFMLITSPFLFVPHFFSDGAGVRRSFGLGLKAFGRGAGKGLLFSLVFIGMSILSVLTVGVLFILWVFPLMIFAYFQLAEKIDGKIRSEDKK